MTDWQEYWNTAPSAFAQGDVLRQVGWTVNGEPIPDAAVDAMVEDIRAGLDLHGGDTLLDLCCGNGFITSRCAEHCAAVTGVDFSAPLIRIAGEHFTSGAVEYVLADVRAIPPVVSRRPYSKILMYGALQHLSPADLGGILDALARSASRGAALLLGAIPDRDRLWHFYDTEERRREYARRVREGTEAIGRWWTAAELSGIAAAHGYRTRILAQSPVLHTSRYRFDSLLVRADSRD